MDLVTMEQRRAKFAYDMVMKVKRNENPNVQESYGNYVKKAPVLILTNGIGQTLAFYLSKLEQLSKNKLESGNINYTNINPQNEQKDDRKAYAYLYVHLAKWLADNITGGEDPLMYYLNHSSLEVIAMTDEAIALLNWMRRFTDAVLEEEGKKTGKGEGHERRTERGRV